MSRAATTSTLTKAHGFLVDGKWISDGETFDVKSPYDGSTIATVHRPSASYIEAAIRAAVRAFETTRHMPGYQRQHILRAIAECVAARREEFARTIALEAGKPIKTARAEVDRAIFTWNIAAEESVRICGEWLPLDLQAPTKGRWAIVRRYPVGPIIAISPFNFPLNLVGHKWAPAIATGCTIAHKPASQTPLSSLMLAGIVEQAGWPAGALNVLPLSGREAEVLVSDDRLKKLTFTGSAEVGWRLKQKAGKKRVTLELGGNAGVIIHHDADLENAAERCVAGGFSYAGQSCVSVQRILVEKSVYEEFLATFVPRVEKLKVGDPLEDSTDVGPMITEADAARATEWVEEAEAAGAKVLCGGKRRGSLVEPTVLSHTRREMRVNCLEVFAPVVTVEPYNDFMEAVKQVNDSSFGLQAGVFTRDLTLAFAAYDQLEVGGVVLGDVPTFRIDHMPYGGVKDSGLGREGLRYAIEEMTERKLLVVNPQ
jgi:acyl-CoA reductase-like NAD-dependent aldehyde dehydrogenase